MKVFLDFEQQVAELESKIDELRHHLRLACLGEAERRRIPVAGAVRDSTGKVTRLVAEIVDLTEQKKAEAAEAMKLTAPDLLELGVVDDIIPEPPGDGRLTLAEGAAQPAARVVSENTSSPSARRTSLKSLERAIPVNPKRLRQRQSRRHCRRGFRRGRCCPTPRRHRRQPAPLR